MVGEQSTKIPVRRITCPGDFRTLDSAMMVHFVVMSGNEAARAIAAELEAFLIDRSDTLRDLSQSERQASDEAAFELVRRIERLGAVVCAGLDQAELRFDDDPSKTRAWNIGCIALSTIDDEAPFVTVKHD